jgi:hypothetical protein
VVGATANAVLQRGSVFESGDADIRSHCEVKAYSMKNFHNLSLKRRYKTKVIHITTNRKKLTY